MASTTRGRLDNELSLVRDKIIQLSSLVDLAIAQSVEALERRDMELARHVVAQDNRINMIRYEIEEECLRILATQQPAATDLRHVIVATHIAVELERIGDHAVGIAGIVNRMETDPELQTLFRLPKMTRRARRMVRESVQAFLDRDESLAHSVIQRDKKLDRHYLKLFRNLIKEMRGDEEAVRSGTFMLWVGHSLERMGDRATNIAERVIFLTTGRYPELHPIL